MDSSKHRLPDRIVTDRLVLTTPTLAHVPAIARLANNRRVNAMMARLPFPYGEDDARFFVETIVPSAGEHCLAVLLGGETFMGIVGLHFRDDLPPELGYWLGEPYWGKGYGTEAARAVVASARSAGYPALRSRALQVNAASRNVLRKAGFSEIGEGIEANNNLAGQPMVLMRLEFGRSPGDALPAIIETERLTLRAPALTDLADLVTLANNPKMVETTATLPFPFTQADGRDFIAQAANSPALRAYAIAERDDRFIGTMLVKFAEGKRPEIGYWLGEPYWGKGFAAEALRALLAAANGLPGFERLTARVLASNAASIRVLEKAGFRLEERTVGVVERHRGKPLLVLAWSAS